MPATRTHSSIPFIIGRAARIGAGFLTAALAATASAECTCAGDLNQDGKVDGADLGALIAAWGTSSADADLNADGIVNGADIGILIAAWGPCAAPVNDHCSNAITVVSGDYPFCTTLADTDGPPPPVNGCSGESFSNIVNDIWYRFDALSNGVLTLSTCGQLNFDSVIAVYGSVVPGVSACPGGGAGLSTFLSCVDDVPECGLGSTVSLPVVAGNVYKIRVGGYPTGWPSGNGVLHVDFESEGSQCSNPIQIPNGTIHYTHSGNTTDNPFGELTSPCVSDYTNSTAEWYRFVPSCNGTVVATTCDPASDFDTVLTIVKNDIGSPDCYSSIVGCNDDSLGADCLLNGAHRLSAYSWNVIAGEVYYIMVSGFNGAAGNYRLHVDVDCN